jgi:hypothetical protein
MQMKFPMTSAGHVGREVMAIGIEISDKLSSRVDSLEFPLRSLTNWIAFCAWSIDPKIISCFPAQGFSIFIIFSKFPLTGQVLSPLMNRRLIFPIFFVHYLFIINISGTGLAGRAFCSKPLLVCRLLIIFDSPEDEEAANRRREHPPQWRSQQKSGHYLAVERIDLINQLTLLAPELHGPASCKPKRSQWLGAGVNQLIRFRGSLD